jgi:hypothetical protein
MSQKQKHSMLVFSDAVAGREEENLIWYAGQHVHDLLRIPGFVGCRYYQLSDHQLAGNQPHKYLMIWDLETDDLPALFEDVRARMKDGRTVFTGSFDMNYVDTTMTPITKYITADEIKGKSVAEVLAISELHVPR